MKKRHLENVGGKDSTKVESRINGTVSLEIGCYVLGDELRNVVRGSEFRGQLREQRLQC
jgi:hypothetical protein